ncbi:hypothetical protein DR64_8443 [Paraburkholderia xenovorans LB400]|nr:hypothetical protein DR64_8443 [Paraburkholderia xenovorans LB400]
MVRFIVQKGIHTRFKSEASCMGTGHATAIVTKWKDSGIPFWVEVRLVVRLGRE